MPLPRDLQALSIEELRSLARDYQLPNVGGLSKATLLYHLESILKYEALSIGALQNLAKERGFSSIAKLKKRQLTRLNHRYDVVYSLTADELRRRAMELAIPQARKLTKPKLVVAYLEPEIISLTEEPHPAKPIEQQASALTIFHPPSSPMKRPRTTRWLGSLLKTSSVFFLGLTVLGVLLVPILLARTINPSRSWLSKTRSTIEGINNVIDSLSIALDDTIEALDSSATSLQSVSQVLDASEPLIESTSVLLGTALPDSIRAT